MKVIAHSISELRTLFTALKKGQGPTNLAILDYVSIHADKENNSLTFIYTDLDTTKFYPAEATVEESGIVNVEFKELDKVFAKLNKSKTDSRLEIFQDDEDQQFDGKLVFFETDKLKFKLVARHVDDFPQVVEEVFNYAEDRVDANTLKEAVKSVLICVSTDDARANLTGAYFTNGKIVSTDGHRLRVKNLETLTVEGIEDPDKGLIIRRRSLEALVYAIDKLNPSNDDVVMTWDKDNVIFQIGKNKISSLLIEGTFPDFTQVLPSRNGTKSAPILNREELIDSIDTVSIFCSPKTHNMKVSANSEGVTLFAGDKDGNKGEITLNTLNQNGFPSVKAGFNYKYLQDALKDTKGSNILMEIIDTLSPTLIFDADNEDDGVWVVMPMRL